MFTNTWCRWRWVPEPKIAPGPLPFWLEGGVRPTARHRHILLLFSISVSKGARSTREFMTRPLANPSWSHLKTAGSQKRQREAQKAKKNCVGPRWRRRGPAGQQVSGGGAHGRHLRVCRPTGLLRSSRRAAESCSPHKANLPPIGQTTSLSYSVSVCIRRQNKARQSYIT